VLKGEVLEHAQLLLEEGGWVPLVAWEVKVLANTLNTAVRAGLLRTPKKKAPTLPAR
jgi:hypothetical protein